MIHTARRKKPETLEELVAERGRSEKQLHHWVNQEKSLKRIAEIAVLKTDIANYAKTRETYVAYRKAGCSKKFLAEHEREITIHKAAKKCFYDMGITKLPSIKSLAAERSKLMAEEKRGVQRIRQSA